jgi:hypothetical protein
MSPKYIEEYKTNGYTIIRQLFTTNEIQEISEAIDIIKSEGLKHESSFRHQNLLYLIQSDPKLGKILRFCHWPSYINDTLEKIRTDLRILNFLKPLIGNNLKQVLNQIIWKTPGSDQTSYGYHQDSRFRRPASEYKNIGTSLVQTTMAIDRHTLENGCLNFIEGSHLLGDLNYYTKGKSVFEENINDKALEFLGISHLPKVNILLEPGDFAIWHPYLLHGSGANTSTHDRRTFTNAYVMAENCNRGEWAFKKGQPVPLAEPVLITYEDLYTRPEPHYIKGPPNPFIKNIK